MTIKNNDTISAANKYISDMSRFRDKPASKVALTTKMRLAILEEQVKVLQQELSRLTSSNQNNALGYVAPSGWVRS